MRRNLATGGQAETFSPNKVAEIAPNKINALCVNWIGMGCAAWGTGSPVPPFCFCPARMHMHARGQRAAVAGGSAYLNELERKALCTAEVRK